MRISDWSSDVCSSDLKLFVAQAPEVAPVLARPEDFANLAHDSFSLVYCGRVFGTKFADRKLRKKRNSFSMIVAVMSASYLLHVCYLTTDGADCRRSHGPPKRADYKKRKHGAVDTHGDGP